MCELVLADLFPPWLAIKALYGKTGSTVGNPFAPSSDRFLARRSCTVTNGNSLSGRLGIHGLLLLRTATVGARPTQARHSSLSKAFMATRSISSSFAVASPTQHLYNCDMSFDLLNKKGQDTQLKMSMVKLAVSVLCSTLILAAIEGLTMPRISHGRLTYF